MFFRIRLLMPSKHLAVFLISAISFVLVASAYSAESHHHLAPSLNLIEEEKIKNGAVIIWGRRRALDERKKDEEKKEEIVSLATERTRRRDILNNSKYYTGGFNLTNEHYWGGVMFTAVPFVVSAIVWFALCGIGLLVTCICYCCRKKKKYGYSRHAYCISLVILIIFTVMAFAGCVVLFTGQGLFYGSSKKTMTYLVKEADQIAQNIRNVSDYLSAAKQVGFDAIVLPEDIQKYIDDGMGKMKRVANLLTEKTETTAKMSNKFLHYFKLTLIIFSVVMIFLVFLGFVLSLFGKRFLVYCLVVFGWILVAGTFILCGAFLVIHKYIPFNCVFGDVCVSMNEWIQKQPQVHTALDDFLPCVDKDVADGIYNRTRVATYYSVVVVNKFIDQAANAESPDQSPLNYNQSGPELQYVCNPLNEDKTDRKCEEGELEMKQVHQEWQKSVCKVSADGKCETEGRLTPTYFEQMSAFINVSYALNRYGPFFRELADCTFVKQTFTDITRDHCPGLRLHSKWIYIGLLMIALAVALSMTFWVIYCRERRHRLYTKKCDSLRSTELFSNQVSGSGNHDNINFGGAKHEGTNSVGSETHEIRTFGTASVGSTNFGSANHGSRHSERTTHE